LVKELKPRESAALSKEEFDIEFKKHQETSRAGAEKKFGGHGLLLDTGELKAKDEAELKIVTRLHTATHLMQAALRKVLGDDVQQRGSDITAERTRFDFAFPRKLTSEEIKKVEDLVNEAIQKDLPVQFKEMAKSEAEKTGALYFFKQKYPDKVKVYYAGHSLDEAFSKEFCGGPHVTNTLTIGKFKIVKEEAVGAGVRRIRAVVE
jgi:alanyl-tRNA synthetase